MAEKQADNNYLALLCIDLEHTAQAFAAGAISKVVFEMRHARHVADVREMAGIGGMAIPAKRGITDSPEAQLAEKLRRMPKEDQPSITA